jgi:cell division protein ZapA (FtsZ GTPase activity inhibitor)
MNREELRQLIRRLDEAAARIHEAAPDEMIYELNLYEAARDVDLAVEYLREQAKKMEGSA